MHTSTLLAWHDALIIVSLVTPSTYEDTSHVPYEVDQLEIKNVEQTIVSPQLDEMHYLPKFSA